MATESRNKIAIIMCLIVKMTVCQFVGVDKHCGVHVVQSYQSQTFTKYRRSCDQAPISIAKSPN